MKAKTSFKVGDSVVVKAHGKDPDLGVNIDGWQGRISEISDTGNMVCVDWDSVTLLGMPDSMIAKCEVDGLGWDQMYLEATEVEATTPRDTESAVAEAAAQLAARHRWSHLDEEGQRIQAVLAGVDADDEWGAFEAWEAHLREVLSFPWEAEVFEFQERGPLQSGDRVTVQGIADTDDLYGVLVHVRRERRKYVFPLCDLEVADAESPYYTVVKDYAVWFANR